MTIPNDRLANMIAHHENMLRLNAGHDDALSTLNAEYHADHLSALRELTAARAAGEGTQRDAARYRYIRQGHDDIEAIQLEDPNDFETLISLYREALDEALDAAIEEQQP